MPVVGIILVTTPIFIILWKVIIAVIPAANRVPNWSAELTAILNPRHNNIINRTIITKVPLNPNSSPIIEKIKSVCWSGR